ncbi:hypothetical protein AAMO2058_000960200 [Amorphochlora amoebiformis]
METESDPHCPDFSHRADRRRHSANPFGLSVVIPPPLPRNRRIITTTRRNSGLGSATWTCPGCGLILRRCKLLIIVNHSVNCIKNRRRLELKTPPKLKSQMNANIEVGSMPDECMYS